MARPRITRSDILEDFRRVEKICPGFSMGKYATLGRYSTGAAINCFGTFNAAKEAAGIQIRTVGHPPAEIESQEDREIGAGMDRFVKPEPEEDRSGMRRCLNGGEMFLSSDVRCVQNCDRHRRSGE